METKNKRKKFYQKKLTLYKSIFSFFLFSGLGVALLTVLYVLVSSMIVSLMVEEGPIQDIFGPSSVIGGTLVNHWFYVILGGVFLIILSVFFTHRFAGPLYRFEVSIDRMINKELGFGIQIREKDECRALAAKLNKLNSGLATTIKEMTEIVDRIDDSQVNLYKELSGKGKVLKENMALNRKLQKILKEFKCE